MIKRYIDIFEREERNVIFHENILEPQLYSDGPHLNSNGTTVLAWNFMSRIRRLWCNVDSSRGNLPKRNNITLTSYTDPLINLNVINPNNYSNLSAGSVLKSYRSKYLKKLIICHLNINFIRNKFEIWKLALPEVLDILMITEFKPDDFCRT